MRDMLLKEALEAAGITTQNYPELYEAIIQEEYCIDNLTKAFITLKEAGITFKDGSELYEIIIQMPDLAGKLATAFIVLKEADITFKDYPVLYEAIIEYASDKLAMAFVRLKKSGITFKDHLILYEAIIKNAPYAMSFATVFEMLKGEGATFEDYPLFYEAIIQSVYHIDTLITAFNALKEVGITFKEHLNLYEVIMEDSAYADEFTMAFIALKDAGITPQDYPALYELVNKDVHSSFSSCLNKVKLLGFQLPDNLEIIQQILNKSIFALDILDWLETNQLTMKTHHYIYNIFFLNEKILLDSTYHYLKVKIKFEQYFKDNPLYLESDEGYQAQRQNIEAIIDEVLYKDFIQGPLNKALATQELELILQQITIEPIENINMRYDESLGYILQFRKAPEIYLSELLRLTNFNHLSLSEADIMLLGDKIAALSPDFVSKRVLLANSFIYKLPDAAINAITCYLDVYYKNINRLFRGVPQLDEDRYVWLEPVHASENLIVNFLAGSLVNWAAAELPRILIATEERVILEKILSRKDNSSEMMKHIQEDATFYKAIIDESLKACVITQDEYDKIKPCFRQLTVFFPIYDQIDRGENLDVSEQDGEHWTMVNRLSNAVFAPSVISFSVLPEGAPYFHQEKTIRTKLEFSSLTRPVISQVEGEILIPQGTTHLYSATKEGFFAREVNSPGILPHGGFWSSTAIAQAYRDYLVKPYKDSASDEITIENKTIYRPNHGLAHTYRIMLYIDVVIDYFAHHAENEMFQLFCQYIMPEEREWLRVAAAYSITGRESEISAGMNLKQYDRYREACMQHMDSFLEKFPPKTDDPLMRERMLEIMRWMGNPRYETEVNDPSPINEYPDSNEREHRNFIYRILTIAHKLDLPRCYGPDQFQAAMAMCRTLSQESPEQQACYLRMIRYALDLNQAHGDRLNTFLSPSGEFISCSEPYRSPFGLVNANLRQLRAVTNTVPQLKLTESYQFPGSENEELIQKVLKICGIRSIPPDNSP